MNYCEKLDITYYSVTEAENILKMIREKADIQGSRKRKYFNISASFDIETTSLYDDEGNKNALMYIWQFGIVDPVTGEFYAILGRTWKEFLQLLDLIKDIFRENKTYFVIYVHNLAFEFSFLYPIIKKNIAEVFATKSNSPIYFRTNTIEFRCSYYLSGMGLKYLPTEHKKLDGDLDYDKPRHALSPLTDDEIAYTIQDVRVVCEYITQKIEQDGGIANIPLTKTGYVRRGLIQHCIGDDFVSDKKTNFIKAISDLQMTAKEYVVLKNAYSGGHTATSPWYHGKIVEDVTCYDFTSSYPAVMCYSDEFPVAKIGYKKKMSDKQYMKEIDKNRAIVAKVTFHNLRIKEEEIDAWISQYKVREIEYYDKNDKKINNGKITRAKKLTLFCTDMDIRIYQMFYDWNSFEAEYCYIYRKGYLPREIITYTLELYRDKTTLKGVEGQELYYALRKELLNSIYGCSVTDPCKPMIYIENGEWKTEEYNEKTIRQKVNDYNKKLMRGKNAMPYHYGVYISAIARYNLALGIYAAGKRDLWVYADTDSIYCTKADKLKDFIDGYNKLVINRLEKMSEYYNIPCELWKPKTVKGVEKPLGVWDFDGHSKFFKALGAKRYIKWTDDDKLKITIAGLSKTEGQKYIVETWGNNGKCTKQIFDNFNDELEIPAGHTGKLTHAVVKYESRGELTDYLGNTCKYLTLGGTHLEPCSFSMSLDALYLEYLAGIKEMEDYNG